MKKLLLLLPLLLFAYFNSALGQAELKLDPKGTDSFFHPDGIGPKKKIYIKYYLINTSSANSDTGTVFTHIRINHKEIDSIEMKTKVNRSLTPYFTKKDSFQVKTFTVLPSSFKPPSVGSPVVIVIWPTGNGFKSTNFSPFRDSFTITYTGIAAVDPEEAYVNIYPNPANDVIHFDIQKQEITLDKVDVADISGRIIFTAINNVQHMDIASLPRGIYILNMHFSDGSTGRYKLLRN